MKAKCLWCGHMQDVTHFDDECCQCGELAFAGERKHMDIITAQIKLERGDYLALQAHCKSRGVDLAQFVRECIDTRYKLNHRDMKRGTYPRKRKGQAE